MRAFIAIGIPAEIRDRLGALSAELRGREPGVSWVKPEAMHLTLRFLGEIADRQVEEISAALGRVTAGLAPFAVRLAGVGVFPGITAPRVLFAGVDLGKDDLVNLAGAVEGAVRQAGCQAERKPFHPHVTVGRVRQGRHLRNSDWWPGMAPADGFGSFEVRSVDLIRSDLLPDGPRYSSLAACPLGGRQDQASVGGNMSTARSDDDER